MDDHFHSSLRELRLQLDLMNSRTASILNKPRQQSNMLTRESSEVDSPSSAMADNMQQIRHIGATVGTLAKNQEDRFQALEHQLDALSDKLDDLALDSPQFTPPESPSESESASSRSETASISSQHSTMPHSPQPTKAPAIVADIGGYFYPNYVQRGHSDQQFITDASSFVGRVNRVLRTKSINSIEIFLKGSALRWFHLGLKTDGTHLFDKSNDEFDIARFCESLILLFGVPAFLENAVSNVTLPLTSSWMRSVIIEDYIFPALESERPQEKLYDKDSGATVAVRKALTLYNQNFKPYTVSLEISDYIAYPEILDYRDLLDLLVDIRCSEVEQEIKKIPSYRQVVINAASARESDCNVSTLTTTGLEDLDWTNHAPQSPQAQSESSTRSVPEFINVEDANSAPIAIESYPPAPTAKSCPTTPIASYHSSSKNLGSAAWTNDVCEETGIAAATQPEERTQSRQNDPMSIRAVLARSAQRTAAAKDKNSVDQSQPIARDIMSCLGGPVHEDSRLTLSASAKSCPFLRESAEIKAILDDIPLIQAPDPPADDEDDKQKWCNTPTSPKVPTSVLPA